MADDTRRQKLSLDSLIEHGLEVAGRPVDRIKVRVPGIGWTVVSLPLDPADDDGEFEEVELELTKTQRTILEILQASPVPLTRRGIANKFKPVRESITGNFGRYIRDMIVRGLIFEHDGDLSDSVAKFKTA